MLSLRVTNTLNETLELTSNPAYTLTSVSGLNPPAASIVSSSNAIFDGETFGSSKIGIRNIVITLALNNINVETNRLALYRYFRPKQTAILELQTSTRHVTITGYVETFECNLFANKQMAQISLLCLSPFFVDYLTNTVEFTASVASLTFPFTLPTVLSQQVNIPSKNIYNSGDVATGMRVSMQMYGIVVNPAIVNSTTNEVFELDDTFLTGDVITIVTNLGHKGVTLTRGGVTTNIINLRTTNSVWHTLEAGSNLYMMSADDGVDNMHTIVTFNPLYLGV